MDKTFGKKVKTWLIINDMKQKDLAEMLDISNPYLSDILLGKREGKKVKEKIMKILEIKEAS
ncbi:transcriptional regulator [Bacillus thuringiensis]|uniref:Helix-turn-helix domain-containing protein n=3 Tax=Bacillus cereus group TaxID=86661 RepID=A0A150C8Z1_BACCE|nr:MULTISPECIES: helix-turn-helix transcriptional regulator [Bacillus cereus group]KXY34644.1 transcriptional regulator [Bacillus cereus]MBG9537059.1 transcriptional regulator [Bacillus thuringiensis]MBG9581036.1 transcriptional regulator [Bacillus thuringiensis]MCQ6286109.1 helix-turn-helix domain-containing protein [Bacillus cereus]MCQ6305990.1 helix-turn-helix domain-containing protein [Bacillus cereus]